MYETILFDFDGTLTPSLDIWLQSFHYALKKYGQQHSDEHVIKYCFYRSFADVASDFGIPDGEELRGHVYTGLETGFTQAVAVSGAREFIEACLRANITTGLVTSSHRTLVDAALEHLDFTELFPVVITSDDVAHYKPHPEPVLRALNSLNKLPDKCLFVGDSSADILSGQAAGVHTALFLPESHRLYYDFDLLISLNPTFTFNSFDQLGERLNLSLPQK